MALATLQINDRYAIVGKTGSGKTSFAMVLAGTMALAMPPPWEAWWLDTKGDPKDTQQLRRWGFRNAASKRDQTQTGGLPNAKYFRIAPVPGNPDSVMMQAQEILGAAYKRRHVLVIVDEYTQVVISKRTAGENLLNIFTRGRGLDIGIIGMTQEPVDIPRQLISQASHLILFSLTYQTDIEYMRKLFRGYTPPIKMGHRYGFWWSWVDGNGEWSFYPSQKSWYDTLRVKIPKIVVTN